MFSDEKFRSRRFILALMAMLFGGACLTIGTTALLLGKPIDGLGAALTGFAAVAGLVLGGYGFTRFNDAGGPSQQSNNNQPGG